MHAREKCQCVKASGFIAFAPNSTRWLEVSEYGISLVSQKTLLETGGAVIFVDRLSNMVHVAPVRKHVAAQAPESLFLDHVFRYHGIRLGSALYHCLLARVP